MPRSHRSSRPPTSGAKTRAELADRLRARRPEIEDAFLTRAAAIGELSAVDDAEYQDGFRRAVHAAFDFAITVVEMEGETPPIPVTLLSQARLAARNSVGIDTIVRRYVACAAVLDSFVISEVNTHAWTVGDSQHLTSARAAAFDLLVEAVSDQHRLERDAQDSLPSDRVLTSIGRILAGAPPERYDLDYDFSDVHVAVVGYGSEAGADIRSLGRLLDGRVLAVQASTDSTWGWIGRRRGFDRDQLACIARDPRAGQAWLGFGEPAKGLAGWRLSHRQAQAALSIALRQPASVVFYGDVCLLAATLQDSTLVSTLRSRFLSPLTDGTGDARLLSTLRAYFAAHRNAVSAAAALGVSRQTVINRLRAVEDRLERSIVDCAPELELMLDLAELA